MSYRPQVKGNSAGQLVDLPLDAETIQGKNIFDNNNIIKKIYLPATQSVLEVSDITTLTAEQLSSLKIGDIVSVTVSEIPYVCELYQVSKMVDDTDYIITLTKLYSNVLTMVHYTYARYNWQYSGTETITYATQTWVQQQGYLTSVSWNIITGKPSNIVTDSHYVHTDNNYTTSDKNKLASFNIVNLNYNLLTTDEEVYNSLNEHTIIVLTKDNTVIQLYCKELYPDDSDLDNTYKIYHTINGTKYISIRLYCVTSRYNQYRWDYSEIDLQASISDLTTIRSGARAGATAVQDINYVHTDNNFTTNDKNKLASFKVIEISNTSGTISNFQELYDIDQHKIEHYVIKYDRGSGNTPLYLFPETIYTLSSGPTENYWLFNGVDSFYGTIYKAKIYLSGSYEITTTDLAFVSDIPSLTGYATQTWVQQQGYLTQHQDISGKLDKSGGTMTGRLIISNGTDNSIIQVASVSSNGYSNIDIYNTNATGKWTIGRQGTDGRFYIGYNNGSSWNDAQFQIDTAVGKAYLNGTRIALTSDIPTKVSAFTNDAGYLTSHQDVNTYYAKARVGENSIYSEIGTSFIGGVGSGPRTGGWEYLYRAQHRNGGGDGGSYIMEIVSNLTSDSSIYWRKKIGGDFLGWRTIIDDTNISSYAITSHQDIGQATLTANLGLGRLDNGITWGTTTASNGYTVRWGTDQPSGGGFVISEKSGQTHIQIDGEVWVSEGQKRLAHRDEAMRYGYIIDSNQVYFNATSGAYFVVWNLYSASIRIRLYNYNSVQYERTVSTDSFILRILPWALVIRGLDGTDYTLSLSSLGSGWRIAFYCPSGASAIVQQLDNMELNPLYD